MSAFAPARTGSSTKTISDDQHARYERFRRGREVFDIESCIRETNRDEPRRTSTRLYGAYGDKRVGRGIRPPRSIPSMFPPA